MKFSLSKIFGRQEKSVPEGIENQLVRHFSGAKNIDWDLKGEVYEAIFYLNDVEHIAKFGKNGELIEFKKNMWPEELPAAVFEKASAQGEIMNAICISRGSEQFFEIIVRDKTFNRSLLNFNSKNELTDTRRI